MNIAPILNYLEIQPAAPSLALLNQILSAWASHIPWESASRVARHQASGDPCDYARLPEAFFESALAHGTGGTCFESNFAFHTLLTELGFDCGLTFCEMGAEIENPHCAIIVRLDGKLYLADVGYPIPVAFPLEAKARTEVETGVYVYAADPIAPNRWAVTRTSGEFQQNCFVLKGEFIERDAFHKRLLRDHEPDGIFLNTVIVSKTYRDHALRYSEDKGLELRRWGKEEQVSLTPEEAANLPVTLARLFHFDEAILRSALERTPLAEKPSSAV